MEMSDFLVYFMKVYGGSEGTAPFIVEPDTIWI